MVRSEIILAIVSAGALTAQNVTTAGYDLARTNANLNETILSPQTVQPSTFGKLFSLAVDGQIYAQPLYMQNVAVNSKTHNVVFVATQHNSVYAFDADTAGPPLWTVNLGPSVSSSSYDTDDGPYDDISPEIGILGTPVIDSSTGTLYLVAATAENGAHYHRLHALDITSGTEKFGAPVVIGAQMRGTGESSAGGSVGFVSSQHLQRPALLLLNGIVYVGFGSHGDGDPWHGWLMGYQAANVQVQTAIFNPTVNGWGGAIWQSGRGPSVDSQGNIYVVTSNGDSDDVTDFSDAVLKLDPKSLTIQDWFAPSDQQSIDDDDEDLGSSGAMLLPGTSLLVTGGKQGMLYMLDTSSLGHVSPGNAQISQSIPGSGTGIFNMAFWSRTGGALFYAIGPNASMQAFELTGNQVNMTPVSQSSVPFSVSYQGMAVSAAGGQPGSGILWVADAATWPLPAAGTLRALNAEDLSTELWNSDMKPSDTLGLFTKFGNPMVANGKVYVASLSNQLLVYGMLAAQPTPVITGVVNAASYSAGAISPGEIVTIYGQNLGPQTLVTGTFDANGNMSAELSGVQVSFNNIPAPVLYTSAGAVSAVVPFELAGTSQAVVQVSYNGQPSAAATFNVVPTAPGIFTANSSGSGEGTIMNEDSTPNSPDLPAAPGSTIVVYATGGGPSNPPDRTGSMAQNRNPLAAINAVTASIGGQQASVIYAGDAPGKIAGMVEFDIQVPWSVTGSVPVVVTVGGANSQATATVVVGGRSINRSSFSRRVRRTP